MTPTPVDEDARRRYWSASLDAATEFMHRAIAAPVAESGEPALDLAAVVPDSLDVEFATPALGSLNTAGLYFLRETLAPRFVATVKELNGLGLGVRVEFGYRTPEMQSSLCSNDTILGRVLASTEWEVGGRPDPALVYERLVVLCANVYKTGTHLGASALDVTILDRETGEEYDRGGEYLTLDVVTPFESPHISVDARRHRALVRGVFGRHGFVAYPYEFWHFSAGDVFEALVTGSDEPARFGPVRLDASTGHVAAVEAPDRELIPRDEMIERIVAVQDGR